jgi:hydroxymethylglutaryl-CoA reductase
MIKLLEVSSAQDLGEIIVAVGLAQNLAACRALVTEGIQRGHMSLHASNIALAAGASPDELPEVVARLIKDKVVRQITPSSCSRKCTRSRRESSDRLSSR